MKLSNLYQVAFTVYDDIIEYEIYQCDLIFDHNNDGINFLKCVS